MMAAATAAFITIFIAEFGDKTQLVSLTMASRYPPLQVLAGAMIALAAVIGIAVGVGEAIALAVPRSVTALISGLFFIVVGIFSYFRRDIKDKESTYKAGFLQTMGLVFVAEFGDKTQLAAMFLTASFGYPLAVFTGAMMAMFLNHLLAVYLGSRIISRFKPHLIKVGTAGMFIAIGTIIIIIEAGSAL